MDVDPLHLAQIGTLLIVELITVLIRFGQQIAHVGRGEQFMDETLSVASWSERLSAAPSGIMVSASHCRIPIAPRSS
jgi:hypothetical protein